MLNLKTKMIAAAASVVAIAGGAATATGSYSYFSDSKANITGSTVTMGTLSLTAGLNDAAYPVTITNAAPGDVVQTGSLAFHNAGSLDGALRLQIVPDAGNAAAFNSDVIITIVGVGYYPDSLPLACGISSTNPPCSGPDTLTKAAALTKDGLLVSPMFAGRFKNFSYSVSISPNAGNEIQALTGKFTINADLVQASTGTDGTLGSVVDGTPSFPAPSAP